MMHSNMLTALPSDMSKLKNLRCLDMEGNRFEEVSCRACLGCRPWAFWEADCDRFLPGGHLLHAPEVLANPRGLNTSAHQRGRCPRC